MIIPKSDLDRFQQLAKEFHVRSRRSGARLKQEELTRLAYTLDILVNTVRILQEVKPCESSSSSPAPKDQKPIELSKKHSCV